jgi:hypothetical protein
MTVPGWTLDGSIHRHDGYAIEPVPGGGWVVRVREPHHPVLDTIEDAHFASLKSAKAAAIHHRMMVTRRTKIIRHAVLALAGVLVVIPTFAIVAPGNANGRVVWFVIGLVVLLLTLRELVGLVMLLFSHGWDYAYDRPRLSRLDTAIADMVIALAHSPVRAGRDGEGPQPVHVVTRDELP